MIWFLFNKKGLLHLNLICNHSWHLTFFFYFTECTTIYFHCKNLVICTICLLRKHLRNLGSLKEGNKLTLDNTAGFYAVPKALTRNVERPTRKGTSPVTFIAFATVLHTQSLRGQSWQSTDSEAVVLSTEKYSVWLCPQLAYLNATGR